MEEYRQKQIDLEYCIRHRAESRANGKNEKNIRKVNCPICGIKR